MRPDRLTRAGAVPFDPNAGAAATLKWLQSVRLRRFLKAFEAEVGDLQREDFDVLKRLVDALRIARSAQAGRTANAAELFHRLLDHVFLREEDCDVGEQPGADALQGGQPLVEGGPIHAPDPDPSPEGGQ